jgi:tetratricopeptide (TPR) repeat protein
MGIITNFFKNRKAAPFKNRGMEALLMRNYEEAVSNFEVALIHFPDDDISLLNLGYAYTGLKKYDKAKEVLERAVGLASPVNPAPQIALAMVHYETANFELAKKHIDEALKIDIKHPAAHYYLGLILLKEGRMDEATEEFEEVISEKPTFVQARILAIGESYLLKDKVFGSITQSEEGNNNSIKDNPTK